VQTDPIGLDGGISSFIYALDSPTRFFDPGGEVVPLALIVGAAFKSCAAGCFGAMVMDQGRCIIPKLINGQPVGQCINDCQPSPCDFAKTYVSGCFAGGVVGGLARAMGVRLVSWIGGATGFVGTSYVEALFPWDPCSAIDGLGFQRPPRPNPINF